MPAKSILVWILAPSRAATTLFRSRPVPGWTVIKRPNQLGAEPGVACCTRARSWYGASAADKKAWLALRAATKSGSFSTWANPTAACKSVIFRL